MTEGVDTTAIAAFAVGFVSFVSPCVLPLVPGYLSAVSGVGIAEMQRGRRLGVIGPALDPRGNSVGGVELLTSLSRRLSLSIFAK